MPSDFKKLNLDRTRLKDCVEEFWKTNNIQDSDFKQRISNSKVCDALELCYNYYVQQRHTLFHANDFTDLSRFIESKESAAQIIEKVIKTIDTTYKITG